jgi:two-component system CheB/CheR fusion protein
MSDPETPVPILKKKYIPTAEFYSQIIDSLQDYSIFTLDLQLNINSWSSGSTKIFGYETDEVIGRPFHIIFTAEDRQNGIPSAEIETSVKEGRAVDNRWHISKDGSLFFAYGLVFPLIGSDGEHLGYVKILRDLTERKMTENAISKYVKDLEELNTHKENILAIVSHDLRSPLTAIIAITEHLQSDHGKMSPDEVQHMLDLLRGAAREELNMLDYLVEWARIKYASEIFSPEPILLAHSAKKVFQSLQEVAAEKNVTLFNGIDAPCRAFADDKMVHSIFQNIISNAIRYSHRDGTVTVTAAESNGTVTVRIEDLGEGMSKELQKKLFTPQLSSLSKARRANNGAGIGLLLVKGFLERNGGTLRVESTEGVGTSFYFTLPIDAPQDHTATQEENSMVDVKTGTE